MSLQANDLLQSRYRIVRSIKEGGMGAVYEAQDLNLANSPCAVKEILDEAREGEDAEYFKEKFYLEMKALTALDHPSIPKVRDYLQVGDTTFIVMDLIQGCSLVDEVEELVALTGLPPEPEKAVQDVISLLDTLTYLHQQTPPLLHRDIKPGNILRDRRSGRIKLVDFGLARTLEATVVVQSMVGTLGYCAPEQMMGKATVASDLYSVGVTLYHLLTGCPPAGKSFEALRPELEGVRPGLADIVEKATQPCPSDRYASAQEMAEALQAWLEPVSSASLRPSPGVTPPAAASGHAIGGSGAVTRGSSRATRGRGAAAMAAVLCWALSLGLLLWQGLRSDAPTPAPVAVQASAPASLLTPVPAAPPPVFGAKSQVAVQRPVTPVASSKNGGVSRRGLSPQPPAPAPSASPAPTSAPQVDVGPAYPTARSAVRLSKPALASSDLGESWTSSTSASPVLGQRAAAWNPQRTTTRPNPTSLAAPARQAKMHWGPPAVNRVRRAMSRL